MNEVRSHCVCLSERVSWGEGGGAPHPSAVVAAGPSAVVAVGPAATTAEGWGMQAHIRLRMLRYTLTSLCWTYFDSGSTSFNTALYIYAYTAIWMLGSARTWHRLGEFPLPWWGPTRIWGCSSRTSHAPKWARYDRTTSCCGLPWSRHLLSLSSNLSVSNCHVGKSEHQLLCHILYM